MSEELNKPQIITAETLVAFKEELLKSIGITISNKSLIQSDSFDTQGSNIDKAVNSAIFGSEHKIDAPKGVKNVLISGYNNIANTWNQTVLGQFNVPNSDALFILGNGAGDLKRSNAIEILKNGNIKIKTCELGITGDKLISTKKIAYDTNLYTDENSFDKLTDFAAIKKFIDGIDNDTELVPIGIVKKLIDYIPTESGLNSLDIAAIIPAEGLNYEGTDKDKKALSIAAAEELKQKLLDIKTDAVYIDLSNKIRRLEENVSYLISCLTVDKVTNADYKKEGDELVEYYAVGLADYALDMDTPFSFADDLSNIENTTEGENE